MVFVSAFHCVKTHIQNIRTTKPTLDPIRMVPVSTLHCVKTCKPTIDPTQMSFQSMFMGKKHFESQSINVSQPEWIL